MLAAACDRPFPIYTAVSVKEAVGPEDEAGGEGEVPVSVSECVCVCVSE
jgi:hypothetical protein